MCITRYYYKVCLHSRQNKKDVLSGAHPKYTQRIQGGTSLFLSEKSALSFCLRVSEYPCPFGPRSGCLQSVIRQQLHRFLPLTEQSIPAGADLCFNWHHVTHTLQDESILANSTRKIKRKWKISGLKFYHIKLWYKDHRIVRSSHVTIQSVSSFLFPLRSLHISVRHAA